ncbi:hypothetical protein MICRO116_110013 [Micrococcus sp. 116]|nr:hypothetical protein MICRO116_110013 [Micrococcus sp. 116]
MAGPADPLRRRALHRRGPDDGRGPGPGGRAEPRVLDQRAVRPGPVRRDARADGLT